MPADRLYTAWTSYAKILPPDATYTQRTETKRAFYAGAQALLGIQMRDLCALSDDHAAHELNLIELELKRFARDVSLGKA